MDLQLTGKRALVTGSTLGIGFATAMALAREGAFVILNGHSQPHMDEAIKKIRDTDPMVDIKGVTADLSGADGVSKLINEVSRLDILVNNMGIYNPKPFEDISDDEWFQIFETNVMSGVRLTRHYLPGMKERNWGRIIFISSESGMSIPPDLIHYGVTKAAYLTMSRGLAEDMSDTGVTVNTVLPGPTHTEGISEYIRKLADEKHISRDRLEKEFFQIARPHSSIKRFLEPEEVASLILYICSPLSSATNGASLRVDGGLVGSGF